MATTYPGLLPRLLSKRKVFISYESSDKAAAEAFINQWSDVFIPKVVGVYGQDIINSTDTEYIIGKIRRDYLADSTVTILLVGSCTHGRRYIDWELKASLRRGLLSIPNGLIGILLPGHQSAHLPDRFATNWNPSDKDCYARYYYPPSSTEQLRNWIEDAYSARTERAQWIKNASDRMKYNSNCKVCQMTH